VPEDSTPNGAAEPDHDDSARDEHVAAASERAPASERPDAVSVAGERDAQPDDHTETVLGEAEQAIDEARRRLAEVPVEDVVTNHVMGLYELAAIHLSATPPNLPAASLAIDAVGSLVDGLGDRLGADTPTLRDALANIRMAFVSVKSAASSASSEAADGSADDAAVADDDTLGAQ
jgi:hypothetical protein